MNSSLTMQLMGGLGNQMFQYAYGTAVAQFNDIDLVLDSNSGFKRDKVYRRSFELGEFPIRSRQATFIDYGAYELERIWSRLMPRRREIETRPWGCSVLENSLNYSQDLDSLKVSSRTYVKGYFQSERYFESIKARIAEHLTPPAPRDIRFQRLADEMQSVNSVAVGVRLFEEVPDSSKNHVTGISFYVNAGNRICESVENPVFYMFCTKRFPTLDEIKLNGEVRYVTHDDGFEGAVDRLWLFSKCRSFIVSHSSFYWWGAWLAEMQAASTTVIASNSFPGNSTVPSRWTRM